MLKKLSNPAWRRQPVRTAMRVVSSMIRQRVPAFREVVVPFDEGRSRVLADLNTALGLTLYRYGIMDAEMALVRRLLSPGDVFVDGGANVGLYTLVAAHAVGPQGQVIAFEPSRNTRQILTRNIALNAYHWVRARAEALDAKQGERSFVARQGDGAGLSSFAPHEVATGDETHVVTTTSLDEATRALERMRVAVIKLDLEGAEFGALRGSTALLRDGSPDIVIELEDAHLRRQGASRAEVFELMTSFGYRFYRVLHNDRGEPILCAHHGPSAHQSGPNLFASKKLDRVERAGVYVAS